MGSRATIEVALQGPHAGMDADDSLLAMHNLLRVIRELERSELEGSPRAAMSKWTFSNLALNSVHATLEPLEVAERSDYTVLERSLHLLVEGFAKAETVAEIPEEWTPGIARIAAETCRKIGGSANVGMVLAMPGSGKSAAITQRAHLNLVNAVTTRYSSLGSKRGHVSRLSDASSHGKVTAVLRTSVGAERIPLICDAGLKDQLRAAWGRDRVEVHGRIQENARGQVVKMVVEEIELLPLEPSMSAEDLKGGFWPDMTGGLSAREHLAVIRGEA